MKILFRQCLRGSIYLLLSSFALPIHAQVSVSGLITDSSNMPIPGVNILLKNTTTGTTTNFEGRFKLEASPSDTLVVSYIGFKTQELAVREQVFFTINLTPEANTLAAVLINAGYYTTTDRERTGSIAKVTAKEIELQPVVSPLQALQGRMAGVEVTPGGNLPGAAPTIRIRGQNSLRKEGNYPLYIIDGMPITSNPLASNSSINFTGIDPLSTLSVSNIESIEVLKDADATAIYGSRGANGVILITTKRGEAGKISMQARISSGFSEVPNSINLLKTQDYIKIREKAFENDAITPNQYNAYDLLLWDKDRNTDWQNEIFGKKADFTQVNLFVTGGSLNTNYRINTSYLKQGTIYPGNSKYQKITGSLQLNHKTNNERLKLGLAINYGVDNNRLVGNNALQTMAFNLAPNAPRIFNEDGSLHWEEWQKAGIENPFQGFHNTSEMKTNSFISNLQVSYSILKDLKWITNLGYTKTQNDELTKIPKRSYNPAYEQYIKHESALIYGQRASWIIEPQLTYQKVFGKLKLDALVGGTLQAQLNNLTELAASGYSTESMIGDLSAATKISRAKFQEIDYRYLAYFTRLGLKLDDKYFLNLTGRRDGSSRFATANRFANFGAVGAAWVFSKESWLQSKDSWFSFGKLRASYGTTGNDQIGDYGYLDSYVATVGPGGLYPTQLANPNYSWEVNKKLEAAVQLGFFKDKLNVNINWYRNRSSNQLVGYNLPAITGFKSVQANLPAEVENKGWELESQISVFDKEHWGWDTSFNISFPINTLRSYPNIEQSPYANRYRVGEPLNIALLYQYEGINPKTGYYQIADINNDGQLDYQDRVITKDINNQYYGGWQNRLNYKNFDLQFLFQFAKKQGVLSLFQTGNIGALRADNYLELEGVKFQKTSTSLDALRAYSNVLNSTFSYTDASYIRLKTMSLGYNLPRNYLKQIGVQNCKIFLHAQNLFTLTKYKGMDPELAIGQETSFGALRTFTTGIEVKF